MKTKTKTLAVVEIVIVLCSMLLVALPAIATANEKTYKHTDLDVFGNANEDDTIDMRDTTYIKLAIFGKKPKTDFADANNDGKVSMLDVGQTKLIILGKEKTLTVLDPADRIVTIEMPVETFIPMMYRTTESMLAIGAKDMIVAVSHTFHERLNGIDEAMGLTELPVICYHGGGGSTDYEYVLSLKPDLVTAEGKVDVVAEKLPGIPVVNFRCGYREDMARQLRTMGLILGKEKEAGELIDWTQRYDEMIEERTEDMTPEEMPTFYMGSAESRLWQRASTPTSNVGSVAEGCGGRNIAAGLQGSKVIVDPEWIMKQNPEVIILTMMHGFDSGPGKTEADLQKVLEEILAGSPEFEKVKAVEDHRVYLLDYDLLYGPRYVIGRCYIAKWLHPELFEDINPEELHSEYLSKFFGIELEGLWAYPLPE